MCRLIKDGFDILKTFFQFSSDFYPDNYHLTKQNTALPLANLYNQLPDKELFLLMAGDNANLAFNELYNRYWSKMYAAAYKRLKNTEAAEEIVQDLFTDVWLRRKTLAISTSLPIFLYSAIRYRVINYIHKELVKNNYAHTVINTVPDFDNSTEEIIIADDLKNRIKNQVILLPEKCREVFELSRNEFKSNKEIAQSLRISEKTVENHITKALRRLRTSLGSFLFFF